MGVRSQTVLRGWVTAYDTTYGKYSPGLILITQLAQAAESIGIQRIDMGKGPESFKRSFASGATDVGEGIVETRLINKVLSQTWLQAKAWVKESTLQTPAKEITNQIRRVING